jgi:tRNA nucleotidyltransferase (CCA-adding enzyme)
VHRADVGKKSIAVALPLFAALVRECINHVAMSAAEHPLAEAKFQAMEVDRVARQLAEKRVEAKSAVAALLLGSVKSDRPPSEPSGPQEVTN